MKKTILGFCLVFFSFLGNAQLVELKIDPIGTAKGRYGAAMEFHLAEDLGVEFNFEHQKNIVKNSFYPYNRNAIKASFRYYLHPKTSCDNLGIGMYIHGSSDFYPEFYDWDDLIYNVDVKQLALGVDVIYKIACLKNFLAEINLGSQLPFYLKSNTSAIRLAPFSYRFCNLRDEIEFPVRLRITYRFGK